MSNKASKIISFAIILAGLAVIILWQIFLSSRMNYYIISVAFLLLSMLPFFVSFERKKISAREITLTSTLIALAVVSRAAFYLVPQVKPIAAVVIASAVCLGAERGYIIGAFSAFISNFFFSQGIWTPFQMAALGLIGFFAGLIFSKIRANKILLSVFGFLAAAVVYSIIVDTSTVLLMFGENLTLSGAVSVYLSGLSFSLVFGVSTAVFLFIFGEGFIRKIERINAKYNLAK